MTSSASLNAPSRLSPTSTPGRARDGGLSFPKVSHLRFPQVPRRAIGVLVFQASYKLVETRHCSARKRALPKLRKTVLMSFVPQKVAMPRDGDARQAIVSFGVEL
jgi:hypothetical protein